MLEQPKSKFQASPHRLVNLHAGRRDEMARCTYEAIKIRFPNEYVARGIQLALVDELDLICGGALLISQPPFRSLQGIPETKASNIRSLVEPGKLAEINGVWLDDRLRGPIPSFFFWFQLLDKLLTTKIPNFLFTFDNSNRRMAAIAQWICPALVYSGKTRQLPGMAGPSNETIAILDRTIVQTIVELIQARKSPKPGSRQLELADRLGNRSMRAA